MLCEANEAVDPGDFHIGFPLRVHLAYVLNLRKEFIQAEELLQKNLQLSYQFGTFSQTSNIQYELGRLALATQHFELAESYIRQSIETETKYGIVYDLSMRQIYLGKSLAAQANRQAARDQFWQVIREGQTYNRSYLVYWGLVCIASTYKEEGQAEKALEMALALRLCPVEFIRIKAEGDRLLSELQSGLPQEQFETAQQQVDSSFAADEAGENALAYALERAEE